MRNLSDLRVLLTTYDIALCLLTHLLKVNLIPQLSSTATNFNVQKRPVKKVVWGFCFLNHRFVNIRKGSFEYQLNSGEDLASSMYVKKWL